MLFSRNVFARAFCAGLVVSCSFAAFGEALYVVDHGSKVLSFDVIGDELIFRNEVSVPRGGGIDLAIDDEHNILFRTVEGSSGIDIVEAHTMTYIKTVNMPELVNSGIVYDARYRQLLCVQRNSNNLYILDWNPGEQTITMQLPHIELAEITYACDLAFNGDILYVSEYRHYGEPTYTKVYAYDMNDSFAYLGTFDMEYPIVGMDYKTSDNSIYGGAWQGQDNQYIVKKMLDPNTVIVKDIGANVIGLNANNSTSGRVFVTTYRNEGTIEIWDTAGWTSDPEQVVEATFEYGKDNADGVTFSGLAGLVIGRNYITPQIELVKYDDAAGCVSPGDEITYTICWENLATTETATEVILKDYLPDSVIYPQGFTTFDPNDPLNPIPPDPAYDPNTHTYIWELGTLFPGDANCVEITVVANEKAEPGMTLHNQAVITSSFGVMQATLDTDVCCWDIVDPNTVYADENATGNNNGTSWQDAYTDLQRAIARATNSACQVGPYTICVAHGTYKPGADTNDTFDIPDGVSVYGGFASGGSDFADRNPDRYVTILSGKISAFMNNDTVVMMGDATLLDGFTVTQAAEYGVYGKDADFAIENCRIISNGVGGLYGGVGLYAENGNVVLRWCDISNNPENGIRHIGAGYTLTLDNCQVIDNRRNGVRADDSTPTVKNSVIAGNGFGDGDFFGIRIATPTDEPVLYNNTIVYNANAGISWVDDFGSGSDPNVLDYPIIQNCILWYNNDGSEQLAGYEFTQYSCVYDPNNSAGTDYTLDGFGNFSGNPGFAYANDPNNYHLAYNSLCKERGNPSFTYVDEVDIDGEDRIYGDYVDIGADEVYSCDDDLTEDDIYNDLDWDADGVVNLYEFSKFSAAWLSHDPNDPGITTDPNYIDEPNYVDPNALVNWNSICDFDDDYDIDLADLAAFAPDWLWIACWKQAQTNRFDNMMASMAMGGGAEGMMAPIPTQPATMPLEPEPETMPLEPEPETMPVEEEPPPVEEKSIAERILDLEESIELLENIWLEDPYIQQKIDPNDWNRFMDAVYDGLDELKI